MVFKHTGRKGLALQRLQVPKDPKMMERSEHFGDARGTGASDLYRENKVLSMYAIILSGCVPAHLYM